MHFMIAAFIMGFLAYRMYVLSSRLADEVPPHTKALAWRLVFAAFFMGAMTYPLGSSFARLFY